MQPIELIGVQLEEARDLINQGSLAHARIAFLLLDNAAEVLMHRDLQFLVQEGLSIHRMISHSRVEIPGDPQRLAVSKTAARKIDRDFNAKLDHLVSLGRLDKRPGRTARRGPTHGPLGVSAINSRQSPTSVLWRGSL